MQEIFDVSGLSYSYGGHCNAIEDVDLRIVRGSIHGLLGDNGSGKSTTLSILARHRRPQAGRLSVGTDSTWDRLRLGWMASDDPALPRGPVGDFIANVLGPTLGLDPHQSALRTREYAQRLEVADLLEKKVQSLSHGQRVRFSILAAFLEAPDLVLLDEPFQGLDPTATYCTREFLLEQNRDHEVSILVSDHRIEVLEGICDAWTFLRQGRCLGQRRRSELREDETLESLYRELHAALPPTSQGPSAIA